MKTGENIEPLLCYDNAKSLSIFALFPGQKLYVSDYHPLKAMESKQVSRNLFYYINAAAHVVNKIPSDNCLSVDSNLSEVISAYKQHELWYTNLLFEQFMYINPLWTTT